MTRDASRPARDDAGDLRPRALRLTAAAALAAAVIVWAAYPVSGGASGTQLALVAAIATGALSVAQLVLATTMAREPDSFAWAARLAHQLVSVVRTLPWAELLTVAALVLEALHKSRPWHTAVLAVALISYLLSVHLAETETGARALRAQLPLVCAGAGLAALAVGVTALPGLPVGPAATALRIGAVVLAVLAAGLAVPAWIGRGR
jgi:hypothetical protein